MKYTSQHCCDKTMDDKMSLYRDWCFPNFTNSLRKIYFASFRGRSP